MDHVYLDVCCLKRPFDDQRQLRIRREASAVAHILERAERGELALVRSPALLLENDRNPREDRRLAAAAWIDGMAVRVDLSAHVEARARQLVALGFGPFDALHIAFAERAGARCLATCDDRLLRLAERLAVQIRVAVVNPCDLAAGSEP